MSALSFLTSAWNWRGLILPALLAVAAFVAFAYVSGLRAERDALAADKARLEASLATAVQAAQDNAAAYDRLKADAAKAVAALEAERAALERRTRRTATLRQEVDRAPQTDDGPVAPVLSRALDGLRRAAAGGGAGDPHRAPGDPGRPAELRSGAGSPGG